jgi:cell shape-determining protein MreC
VILTDNYYCHLQKLISSSIAENDFSINRLKEKNEEIEKLTNTVKQLTDKVDYLYDENLTLKSQIGSSFVHVPSVVLF